MAAAAASSSSSSKSIVGSTISLISKAGIRYEGRCVFLDLKDCLLGLTHVKIFRAEGRTDNVEILSLNTYYDTILFRGSEIKELKVISTHDLHDTYPKVANITADIETRLCSLLQGISSASQSLWSSEFCVPISNPPVANLDGLGLPTYFPGLARSTRSPGIISRPKRSQGLVSPTPSTIEQDATICAEGAIDLKETFSPFEKSTLGICLESNHSAAEAFEPASSTSDQHSLKSPYGEV